MQPGGAQGDQDVAAVVDEDVIAEVLAATTGIPVFRISEEESSRLLKMEDELHKRVIGQDEAIKSLSRAIRRTRAGLKDPNRPSGSFIFAGPTGVGKTELAKSLAEFLFGDEDALITLDMSEFQEKHTVSRLFGAPPGYVGYDEAGQLTESALLALLEALPPGDFELGCHPGEGRPHVPEDPAWTYGWQSELDALTSPRVRARLEQLGVELTTYGALSAVPSPAVASAT